MKAKREPLTPAAAATAQAGPAGGLTGYEVVVGVCGGIAAYKVCAAVSRLVQRGAGVTVAMTKAAQRFVGPMTFQALTGRKVLTSLWHRDRPQDVQHITLTGAADLMLIAPATANVIAKVAAGIADDLLSTLIVSADSPVHMAPAMNDHMWANPIVQRNVETLRGVGVHFIGPGEGWLACRSIGPGRMVEAEVLVEAVEVALKSQPPKACRSMQPGGIGQAASKE